MRMSLLTKAVHGHMPGVLCARCIPGCCFALTVFAQNLTGLKLGSVGLSGTKVIEAEKGEIEDISLGNLTLLSFHKISYPV